MIDVSERREAVIWPIKACLQPTDTACGTWRIGLTHIHVGVLVCHKCYSMYKYVHSGWCPFPKQATELNEVGELVLRGLAGFPLSPRYMRALLSDHTLNT